MIGNENEKPRSQIEYPLDMISQGAIKEFMEKNYPPINGRAAGTGVTSLAIGFTRLTPTLIFANGIAWDIVNKKFIISVAGQYLVTIQITWTSVTNSKTFGSCIYKNNAMYSYSFTQAGMNPVNSVVSLVSDIVDLAVGDTIQMEALHFSAVNETVSSDPLLTFISICKV